MKISYLIEARDKTGISVENTITAARQINAVGSYTGQVRDSRPALKRSNDYAANSHRKSNAERLRWDADGCFHC